MSLPWFPYHIDKFLSDTLALDGTAVGAYHLLMLHYYATGTPPRDNDRVLATIARLPIDVWTERRPEIAAFFQISDGAWHHATIESEMLEASEKHAAGIARASAGGKARWSKTPAKPATSKRQAVPQASVELASAMKTAQSNAPAVPTAVLEQSLVTAHLQEQISLSVVDVAGEKDNSGDNSGTEVEETLGTPIAADYWPGEDMLAVCRADGAPEDEIKKEVRSFIHTHQARATFSHAWDASFAIWWSRWKTHHEKEAAKAAPKPRVEVSNKPDWPAHAKRWADGMGWPRGIGGEPGSPRCRCPEDILRQHNIDPSTGLQTPTLTPEKV